MDGGKNVRGTKVSLVAAQRFRRYQRLCNISLQPNSPAGIALEEYAYVGGALNALTHVAPKLCCGHCVIRSVSCGTPVHNALSKSVMPT